MAGMRSGGPPGVLSDGVVLLRAEEPGDLDDIVAGCDDARTAAWVPVPVPYGPDDARAWLARRATDAQWWASPMWAVTTPPSSRWGGSVGLVLDGAGAAEVGYLLAPWARGIGLAERALRLACAFAFGTLGLQVVTWRAYVGNEASREAAVRVGFDVPDHVFPRWAVHRDERRDCWLGTLTPSALTSASRLAGPVPGPALTDREREVLACLVRGDTNADIALRLDISVNTVKNHVRSILEKLQARSRAEAVVIGLRRGLASLHG